MAYEIELQRIDPARNMQRYYGVSLQPDLFGGIALVRSWGRIGSRARFKSEFFVDGSAALTALQRLVCAKRPQWLSNSLQPALSRL